VVQLDDLLHALPTLTVAGPASITCAVLLPLNWPEAVRDPLLLPGRWAAPSSWALSLT
jgi:hypothetical protein